MLAWPAAAGAARGSVMLIAVSGATGFIGRSLVAHLREQGHHVRALVRDLGRAEDALGDRAELRAVDPVDPRDLRDALRDVDAVVNLAGSGIFETRWNKSVRKALRDSRVVTTRTFYDALHEVPLEARPKVFVSASAIGIYGNRAAGVACREDEHDATNFAPPDFLAHVCEEWEAAARRLVRLGLRVVTLRIGVVLGRGGGALAQLEPVARMRLSTRLGSGRQVVSWIHQADLLRVIDLALQSPTLAGAVNVTAPEPVSNGVLARALARAIGRRALPLGMPKPAARLIFGRGRADALLGGQEVRPYVLEARGFRFLFPTIDEALADLYVAERAAGGMGLPVRPADAPESSVARR